MAQDWFVKLGDRIDGPFTSRELADRASTGRLRPTDEVSTDRTKWRPAAKVKGLTFLHPDDVTTALGSTDDFLPAPPLESVPGYRIEGALGAGGMGVVYRARQLKLDRVVALKTIAVTPNPELVTRFEKEAVALAKLQHPNIVSVYDSGRVGERLYFAMELLDGEDLDRRITRDGPLDERTAWLIARQTAAALAHASVHNITHRDVKPGNLFLIPPPVGSELPPGVPMVKVTDFGLALTRGPADQRLTVTGTALGTPIYMAPEQFKTSTLDHRADLYSLGASMYHALAGEVPFDKLSIWELMLAKSNAAPRLQPPVSEESIELVAAMMASSPADRPANYEELIARIDALKCLREGPVAERRPLPHKRRTWPLLAAGGVVAFLVTVGIGFALFNGGTPTKPTAEVRYVPSGTSVELYTAGSALRWQGGAGGGVEIEDDADLSPVLLGKGKIRRALDPLPSFRVTLGLDLHKAKQLDVVFLVPANDAPRTVLRITRHSVTLGTKVGDAGKFNPVGDELLILDKGGYREVKFEKAGAVWRVSFDGQPVGSVADDGTPRANEFHLVGEGGPFRLEAAHLEELIETK